MRLDTKIAAATIQKLSKLRPELALVLGSGFGEALEKIKIEARLPYAKIPGFPKPTVAGHAGELVIGKISAAPVLILSGRAHFYEGHSMEQVTFPIRVLHALGIRDVLLTNAAGGINRRFQPGDFMLIRDHINLMGENPLRANSAPGLARFVDLTRVYDAGLTSLLMTAARKCDVKLHAGVYLAVSGPSYETPAEIRAFARLGADAVGMSTVPEAIVARQCGLRVAAISCISNRAAGIGTSPLSHADVLETARHSQPRAARLIEAFAHMYAAA